MCYVWGRGVVVVVAVNHDRGRWKEVTKGPDSLWTLDIALLLWCILIKNPDREFGEGVAVLMTHVLHWRQKDLP